MSTPACPRCGLLTFKGRANDIEAFRCKECGGHTVIGATLHVFLDRHVHERAFEKLMQRARDSARSPRQLNCPTCHTASFHELRVGLLDIDVCDTCIGLYLDKGEASLYLLQERARPTASKVGDRALETSDAIDIVGDIFRAIF